MFISVLGVLVLILLAFNFEVCKVIRNLFLVEVDLKFQTHDFKCSIILNPTNFIFFL